MDTHLRITYASVVDAEQACAALHRLAELWPADDCDSEESGETSEETRRARALFGERPFAQLLETIECRASEVDLDSATRAVWALSVVGVRSDALLQGLELAACSAMKAQDVRAAASAARAFACAKAAFEFRAEKLHAAIAQALLAPTLDDCEADEDCDAESGDSSDDAAVRRLGLEDVASLASSLAVAVDDAESASNAVGGREALSRPLRRGAGVQRQKLSICNSRWCLREWGETGVWARGAYDRECSGKPHCRPRSSRVGTLHTSRIGCFETYRSHMRRERTPNIAPVCVGT